MSWCGNLYFRRVRIWSYLTNVLSHPFLAPPTLSRGNLKTQLYFKDSRPQRPRSFGQHQESRPLAPTPEVRDSRTSRHSAHAQSQVWQIWLVLVSICCVVKSIQNRNVVGPGQRSRVLVLTKRSAASGNEFVFWGLRASKMMTSFPCPSFPQTYIQHGHFEALLQWNRCFSNIIRTKLLGCGSPVNFSPHTRLEVITLTAK